MAASHSGEDLHVRTLQAMFRRTGASQGGLSLARRGRRSTRLPRRGSRDGERPGEIRHMCSGYHAPSCRWRAPRLESRRLLAEDHRRQQAARDTVARVGTPPARLVSGIDACGVPTYAFPLREIARAYAPWQTRRSARRGSPRHARGLAAPGPRRDGRPSRDGRRHAIGWTHRWPRPPGSHRREGRRGGLRCFAILPGLAPAARRPRRAWRSRSRTAVRRIARPRPPRSRRWPRPASSTARRCGSSGHRPIGSDPHGRAAAEAVASFELAPVGELVG